MDILKQKFVNIFLLNSVRVFDIKLSNYLHNIYRVYNEQ